MSQESGYKLSIPQEVRRFKPEEIEGLAKTIIGYSLDVQQGDRLLIKYQPGAKPLMDAVRELTLGIKAEAQELIDDPLAKASKLKSLSADTPAAVYEEMLADEIRKTEWANKMVGLFSNDYPRAMEGVDGRVVAAYLTAQGPIRELVPSRRWFIISLPTPAEAGIEKMSFRSYKEMCFRAYNRSWEDVELAQDIFINEILNGGKQLELHANKNLKPKWQTHLEMSIEGQTPFANSTFRRNIGSESFSAPARYTATGRLAVPYRVMFQGIILSNLILDFKDGKVVDFWTRGEKNRDWVEKILDTDEGAREVGEIAFGTNPEFNRPLVDRTKVEKVLGFHIALGESLRDTVYMGRPVRVDNKVRSAVHIDLANVVVLPWGGEVYLDGRLIQQNGVFLDPRSGRPDPRLAIISAK